MEFFYHGAEQDVLVLAADGGLNSANTAQFIEEIEKLVNSGLRKIIVDCSKLNYISSYGVSVLLRLHKWMSAKGGDVKLAGVGGFMVAVLRTVGLGKMWGVYKDVEAARIAFGLPPTDPDKPRG